jgi:hypothetical protein
MISIISQWQKNLKDSEASEASEASEGSVHTIHNLLSHRRDLSSTSGRVNIQGSLGAWARQDTRRRGVTSHLGVSLRHGVDFWDTEGSRLKNQRVEEKQKLPQKSSSSRQ